MRLFAVGVISALGLVLSVTGVNGEHRETPNRFLCPRAIADFPAPDPEDQFRTRRLDGKRMIRARRIARRYSCEIRVIKRNGRELFITYDLRTDRVNVHVRDGRVSRVRATY